MKRILLLLTLLAITTYANRDINRPKVVDMIRGKLEKPLIYVEDKNGGTLKFPKVLITKDMYNELFTYVKYLESENSIDEVNTIYIDTLEGLKSLKPTQFMSLVFRLSIESVVLKSIKDHQAKYSLTKELKEKLKVSLLTDNDFLLKALDAEKNITIRLVQNSLLANSPNEFTLLVFKYQKEYIEKDFKLQVEAIKSGSFENLKSFREKEKEKYTSTSSKIVFLLDSAKVKLYNLLGIKNDYTKVTRYVAKLSSLATTPKVIETFTDYLTQVKSNKDFLEKL